MICRESCGEYKTLRVHFLQYFRKLLEYTVDHLKFFYMYDIKTLGNERDTQKKVIEKLKVLVKIHCGLIELKKSKAFKDINILTLIKNSKLFINNFIKY